MLRNTIITICTLLLFVTLAFTTIAVQPAPILTPQQEASFKVDYELPYPGIILPDNFLYPLKVFRDRAVLFFISDPYKRAQFDLLQSDKRLGEGEEMLKEKNPSQKLISETLSKGENYFWEAIQNISKAKKQGMLVNDFLETLKKAGLKHQQVLYIMSSKTSGQLKQSIIDDMSRVEDFEEQVDKIKPHK